MWIFHLAQFPQESKKVTVGVGAKEDGEWERMVMLRGMTKEWKNLMMKSCSLKRRGITADWIDGRRSTSEKIILNGMVKILLCKAHLLTRIRL